MTLAWTISRELARENGGSARGWLSAGLVLAWKQWRAEEALIAELEVSEQTWVKPEYKIIKNRAWRTKKFDEYQLEVLFKGQSIMVDYEIAKTDGLLKAIEKAGKETEKDSMKELLRELWLVVKPYRDAALAKEEAAVGTPLADARQAKEVFTYKDTVKGIMYDVKFRGRTLSIVKAIVLKHGWKKAIEHTANQSNSEQHKELLRGLWKAV